MAKFDKVFNKRAYDEAYKMAADNPFGHMSALEAMAEGKRHGAPSSTAVVNPIVTTLFVCRDSAVQRGRLDWREDGV